MKGILLAVAAIGMLSMGYEIASAGQPCVNCRPAVAMQVVPPAPAVSVSVSSAPIAAAGVSYFVPQVVSERVVSSTPVQTVEVPTVTTTAAPQMIYSCVNGQCGYRSVPTRTTVRTDAYGGTYTRVRTGYIFNGPIARWWRR